MRPKLNPDFDPFDSRAGGPHKGMIALLAMLTILLLAPAAIERFRACRASDGLVTAHCMVRGR